MRHLFAWCRFDSAHTEKWSSSHVCNQIIPQCARCDVQCKTRSVAQVEGTSQVLGPSHLGQRWNAPSKKSCTSHRWFDVAILTSTTIGIKVHSDKGFSTDRVHTGIPTVAHVGLQRTRRQCRQQCPVTRKSGTINKFGCMTKLIFRKGARHRCARDEPRLQKGMFRIPSCALESVLRSDLQKPYASSSTHSSVLARMLVVLASNGRFKSLENSSLIHDVRTRGVHTKRGTSECPAGFWNMFHCTHDVLEDVLGDAVRPKLGRACAPLVRPVDELDVGYARIHQPRTHNQHPLPHARQQNCAVQVVCGQLTAQTQHAVVRWRHRRAACRCSFSKGPSVQNQRRLQEPKGNVCNRWKPRTNSHEVATAHRLRTTS